MKKFTVDELKEAIHQKFDTLEDLADRLGATKQDISAKLRRQSPKFLNQLKSAGIVLPYKTESKNLIVGEEKVYYLLDKVIELEKMVPILETKIKQLEEENAKLRVLSTSISKNSKGTKIR